MTPAARTQAAIELIDAILVAAREGGAAADTLVSRYFATRRYAGSKDRRAVRDLVYAAIRRAGEAPVSGRAAMIGVAQDDAALAATFDGIGHGPAPISPDEPVAPVGVAPAWLIAALAASGLDEAEAEALTARAPLDVRVNRLLSDPATIAAAVPGAEAINGLEDGLRLPSGISVDALAGQVEVQDAGSQFVSLAAGAVPGMDVIDLCAGAGGKTLALAAAMHNEGRIIACDVDRGRLSRLSPRAARAGVTIAQTRLLNPGREREMLADLEGAADLVLVDAPCSGTGTWRRNPEARWRLTPARLERLIETQRGLLAQGALLVKPGGTLIHIVCSVLDAEGTAQIDTFLSDHPGWKAEALALPVGRTHGHGVRLTPLADGTDGFFVARLRAPC